MRNTNQKKESEARNNAEEARIEAVESKKTAEAATKLAKEAEVKTKQALQNTAAALKKEETAVKIATQEKTAAEQQRQRAEASERNAREALHQATVLRLTMEGPAIVTQVRSGSTLQGALLARVAHRYQPGGEAYGGLLAIAEYLHQTRRIIESPDRVRSVAFSPDGKRIVSGSCDNTVRLWDADSGKPIGEPMKGHTNRVYSVAFSPDGKPHRVGE